MNHQFHLWIEQQQGGVSWALKAKDADRVETAIEGEPERVLATAAILLRQHGAVMTKLHLANFRREQERFIHIILGLPVGA